MGILAQGSSLGVGLHFLISRLVTLCNSTTSTTCLFSLHRKVVVAHQIMDFDLDATRCYITDKSCCVTQLPPVKLHQI